MCVHGTGSGPRDGSESARPRPCVVGAREQYSSGAASLLVTGVLVVLGSSALAAAVGSLGLLGPTWLVLLALAVWFGTWLLLEVVWEWRAGRLPTRG